MQAAMSLQSNFPKERKYYFWAIFLCHLISVDGSSPEADRKLFGTLAYRMISKAVDNVPSDPVWLSLCLSGMIIMSSRTGRIAERPESYSNLRGNDSADQDL